MHSALPMGLMGCLLALAGVALAAAPITLVDDGKPAATIVIADDPTAIPVGKGAAKGKPPTVAYAAEELQRFIEKASGARLEIVPASKAPSTGRDNSTTPWQMRTRPRKTASTYVSAHASSKSSSRGASSVTNSFCCPASTTSAHSV